MNINRLRQWSVEFWGWLAEAKTIICLLLVIAIAVFLGMFVWHSEVSVRSAGYGLQLIGMIFAIRGLLNIRKHFGQPLLRQIFLIWVKRFPKWKKNYIICPDDLEFALGIDRGTVEAWMPDRADQPTEERIEGIVKNIEIIKNKLTQIENSIDKLITSQKKHAKESAKRVEKMEEDIHSFLKNLHTSDLITALGGLVWLTVGITLSTMAPEIHQWLQWLHCA